MKMPSLMTKTWFTSDTHFGHARIIELARRPFVDVHAMNESMIRAWNERVAPDDTVWHLGDFGLGSDETIEETFHRLHGVKHLVIGNHDAEREVTLNLAWASVNLIATITVDGQKISMCHYPMKSWPMARKGAIHLFGHMHGRLKGTNRSLDVGTDAWSFQPILLRDILRRLKTLPGDPELSDSYFSKASVPMRKEPTS
jgi:calcineurin-like phosphoesterase family protein